MSRRIRKDGSVFLSALFFFVASLGTAESVRAQNAGPENRGYVHLAIPRGAAPEVVYLRLASTGEELPLARRAGTHVAAFGAWLPEGEYKLARWEFPENQTYVLDDYDPINVRAGRLTDLGEILPVHVGGYQFVAMPVRRDDPYVRMENVVEELSPNLRDPTPIRWLPTQVPKPFEITFRSPGYGALGNALVSRAFNRNRPPLRKKLLDAPDLRAFYFAATEALMPLSTVPVATGDQLLFLADFGQIRVRSRDGEWSTLHTGSIMPTTALGVDGDVMMAGFPDGEMRLSTDRGATWRSVAMFDRGEEVRSIIRAGERWIVATMRGVQDNHSGKTTARHRIYVAGAHDMSNRVLVWDKTVQIPAWRFRSAIDAGVHGDWYIAVMNDDAARIDLRDGSVSDVELPSALSGMRMSKSTGMLTVFLAKGLASKVFVSDDMGDTWRSKRAPGMIISDVLFHDDTHGVAIRNQTNRDIVVQQLLEFDQNRGGWKRAGTLAPGCTTAMFDGEHHPVFCVSLSGDIYAKVGDGWRKEVSTE